MASTEPRRLVNLPGYDTAPDIYETQISPSDASTTLTQQTSAPSSEASETSDEEDDTGISRRRLYPERARNRFSASARGVDANGTDLSDRVDGRRKGYRVRRRGDVEDEDEGLEARIARLRREIEECRAEATDAAREGKEETASGEDWGAEEAETDVESLSRLLAGLERPTGQRRHKVEGMHLEEPDGDEQTLTRVADFDTRLSGLEQALGISALDSVNADAISAPLLSSLTLLDQQLSALTSATSLANLEAASSKIQKLRNEADAFSQSQRPSTASSDQTTDESTLQLSQEDLTNLHQLYTLLPTLQSLAPTVPALLTRLRSLRTLHTSAANAASELDEVEKRQAEMDNELKAWREGLERVESAVREASEANGRNGKVVEGWVRELEGRMKGLGR